jgi:hypothetical protein
VSPLPQVVCAQCGAAGGPGLTCAKCGGALVKVCPNCEFKNSTVKNYCDACGTEIRMTQEGGTASPPPPQTITRRPGQTTGGPLPPPGGITGLPQAGRSQQSFEPPPVPAAGAPAPQPMPGPRTEAAAKRAVPISRPFLPSGMAYFAKSVLAILFMLVMVGGAVFGLLLLRRQTSADVVVPKLARQYLESLQSNDYATAYNMLTEAARASCSLDEFRLLRDTTPWTWSNLSTAKIEPGAVVLQYDLSVENRPTIRDTLVFVNENGRWARPYNWPVLLKAEQAFERNDPDMALMQAGEAVRLDPRDPMARGYLCESVFFRRLTSRIESECRTALDLADRYPSKLSAKSLYHLHAILAEYYRTTPGSESKAIGEYTTMLQFPDMSPQDQCELYTARADMYSRLSQNAEADADRTSAKSVCPATAR